jgi:hypothetical protein
MRSSTTTAAASPGTRSGPTTGCNTTSRVPSGTGPGATSSATYDKDAGAKNQRLYLNGARVAQMSDTQPIDLNSAALGIGRHVSGIADPFDGHIDEFRIVRVQRSGDLKRRNGAAAEAEQRATCLRMASGTGAAQIHPCRGDRRPVLSGIRHRLRARIDRPPSRAHPDPCCGHSGISDQSTGSTRLPTLKAPAPRVSRAEANLVE